MEDVIFQFLYGYDGSDVITANEFTLAQILEGEEHAFYSALRKASYGCKRLHTRQYIGFRDKDKAKIFEGDIVQYGGKSGYKHEVRIETFQDSDGAFCCGYTFASSRTRGCVVIGNIHQNPELIEGVEE